MKLVNSSLGVEEGAFVEKVVACFTVVGQGCLDLCVTDWGKSYVKWSDSLVKVDCCAADSRRQSQDVRQRSLHDVFFGMISNENCGRQ